MQFVFPIFSLRSVDVTLLNQKMERNSIKAEAMAMILNTPVISSNYDDLKKRIAINLQQ